MIDAQGKNLANVSRLHEFMDRDGCSAVVARSGKNFTYLTGVAFPGSQGRHVDFSDSPREVYVVWPRHGEPVIIVGTVGVARLRRDSWISTIEEYGDYRQTAVECTVDVIKRLGLEKSKLGFEKTYLSAVRWEEFTQLLPNGEMFDCTEMMDAVRWIKTPEEIKLLRRAADLQDQAYIETFSQSSVGDTEREVHSRLIQACLARGAEIVHGCLNTSRNIPMYLGESDNTFQLGDIVKTDYVSYLQGYPGHQSRSFVVGKPSKEQVEAYRKYRDSHYTIIDACRPGIKASEVYQLADETLRSSGFGRAGSMVGHGVGPWFHQQEPLLVADCETQLEEGMVIAVEPFVGYWHLQDLILVTNNEPELLSETFDTRELFVIG